MTFPKSPQREEVEETLAWMFTRKIAVSELTAVLEVGIGGDPDGGGNRRYFRNGCYKTLDVDAQYAPDIVGDICAPPLPAASQDLVILSNVLEHIWDYKAALQGCHNILRPSGYLVITIPWEYPYHAEPNDYWRMSATALHRLLTPMFAAVETVQKRRNSYAIATK